MAVMTSTMPDVPTIAPDRFVNLIAGEFIRKTPVQNRPVMLWGAPGIGKSDCVQQVMDRVSEAHGKPYFMQDVRASLYNPTDLKGIPCPDADRTKTTWLKPDIFDMNPSPSVGNFLFFDEISYASPSTSQALLQILLNRQVAQHKLPDNCYLICAGNRVSDKSGAQKMIKPAANRIRHFEMVPTLKAFKAWALRRPNFDTRLIAFLNFRENLLMQYDPSSDNVAFPTPRSWAAVSDTTYGAEISDMYELIAGDVGESAANEFLVYSRVYEQLPSVDSIAAGKEVKVPVEPDIAYALCGALVSKMNTLEVSEQAKIENVLRYLLKMAREYQWATFYDLWKLPNSLQKFGKSRQFIDWARANRTHLE